MAGVTIVNLALVSYTVGIILQSRKMAITRNVLLFLTIGVVFDITSTICMVISSGHALTLHGFIGYSSLIGMLADTVMSWRHSSKHGPDAIISKGFNNWSRVAFIYWVFAYVSGIVIVSLR